jgi:hypothetical protein
MPDLREILENPALKDKIELLQEVRKPVSMGAYPADGTAKTLDFDTGDRQIDVFDQALSVGAKGSLELRIAAPGAAVDNLFGTGEQAEPPAGQSFTHLDLDLGVSVKAGSTLSTEPLTLTFTGAADAGFSYQHLLPVAGTETRLEAALANLGGSRLPAFLDLEEIADAEVHRFDARFNLDLGLKATWGYAQDFSRTFENLFAGTSPTVTAQATASFEAALGWSLHEDFLGVVGHSNMLNKDWARLRLQRTHQNRLSFGAMVALEVNYNLADALDSILRRGLDLTPLPRVISALEEVAALESAENLRDQLTDRASDALADFLDDTGWRDQLNDASFVTTLVDQANKIVSAYNALPGQVQSWWDDLLGRVQLGADSQVRTVLTRLKELADNPPTVDRLLADNPEARNTVEILEALSGQSLEDLLLSPEATLREVLTQVGHRADEALRFLGQLDAIPGDVVGRFHRFAEKSGIQDVITFLSENATSKAQLETAIANQARATLRSLVSRLTDKAFDQVTDQDVTRVREWAQGILDRYQALQGKVQEAIDKTRGRFGFSLSLVVDRVTREQAWIDLEFNPRHDKVRAIVQKALRRGSPRVLLEELSLEDPDTGEAPAFQIREAVFSFRRSRSASVLLSSLGVQLLGTRGERIDEYTVRLGQPAPGVPIDREARYSGGYLRTQIHGSSSVHSAVWLDSHVRDQAAAAMAPYQGVHHTLRLTLGWQDLATTPAQVKALGDILLDLGFPALPGKALNAVADISSAGVPTRFALELRLPEAAVPAILEIPGGQPGEDAWALDYRHAGLRWYGETLNADTLAKPKGMSIGAVLRWVLRQPRFLSRWTEGVNTFTDWAEQERAFGRRKEIPGTDGRRVNVNLITHRGLPNRIARWNPNFNSLAYFLDHRGKGLASYRRLAADFAAVQTQATGTALAQQTRSAADTFRRAFATAPLDSSSWTNPTFHFWLILARLARVAPTELANVQGVYSFRWKAPSDTDAWQDPVVARLDGGLDPVRLAKTFEG